MRTIGSGASEIRIHAESEYRMISVARFAEAVYVLHAFAKHTRQTSQRDLERARVRLRVITQWRRQRSVKRSGGNE